MYYKENAINKYHLKFINYFRHGGKFANGILHALNERQNVFHKQDSYDIYKGGKANNIFYSMFQIKRKHFFHPRTSAFTKY